MKRINSILNRYKHKGYVRSLFANKPAPYKTPNMKLKNLLDTLDDKINVLEEKIGQGIKVVVDGANNTIDVAKRVGIAGVNVLFDVSEKKESEEIVKNTCAILTADNATKKMLEVQIDSLLPRGDPAVKSMLCEHINRILTTSIPDTNNIRARKYVRFAAHVYGSYSDRILPKGCICLNTHKTKEGLDAAVYDNRGEIICAFAGSETWIDWKNNITQLGGFSKQYEEALVYAKDLRKRFSNKELIFVGHSLGGGEAAYCAYNLGMEAETFNPAGLSFPTRHKNDKCIITEAKINAYVFSTDVLNFFQTTLNVGLGSIRADGNIHRIRDANIFEHGIHGIDGILKYFKIDY